MNTLDETAGMDPAMKAEMQAACDRLVRGVRDPEEARKSRERMAQAREEFRKRLGVQKIVVDLVRQTRESQ